MPEHVTLPLLTLITRNSLDEDYQHVADRKAAAGKAPKTPKVPRRRAALVVGVFGLLIVTAAVQTSRQAATTAAGREELIEQIRKRSDELRNHQDRISDLTRETSQLRSEVDRLTTEERAAASRVLLLRGRTGYGPVTGPGARIVVDDSRDDDPDGVVRDSDLAVLVNGLWAAGAEAISINGQRLTALTGIRSTGPAIHIKAISLKPPYVVLAVGNPNTLQARFADTSAGAEWFNLVANFHFEVDRDNAESLSLPGRQPPFLRSATVLELPDNKEAIK